MPFLLVPPKVVRERFLLSFATRFCHFLFRLSSFPLFLLLFLVGHSRSRQSQEHRPDLYSVNLGGGGGGEAKEDPPKRRRLFPPLQTNILDLAPNPFFPLLLLPRPPPNSFASQAQKRQIRRKKKGRRRQKEGRTLAFTTQPRPNFASLER